MSISADVVKFYFRPAEEPENFQCQFCPIKRKKNQGLTNLKSHIKDKHTDWKEIYEAASREGPGAMDNFVVKASSDAVNIHSWIEWILRCNEPPTFVESKYTRKYTSLDPISRNTLSKYMEKVCIKILNRIDIKLIFYIIAERSCHGECCYPVARFVWFNF